MIFFSPFSALREPRLASAQGAVLEGALVAEGPFCHPRRLASGLIFQPPPPAPQLPTVGTRANVHLGMLHSNRGQSHNTD